MHDSTQTTHQRNATGLLAAMRDRRLHVYGGTVPGAVVAERRRRNRAARKARRTHRLATR